MSAIEIVDIPVDGVPRRGKLLPLFGQLKDLPAGKALSHPTLTHSEYSQLNVIAKKFGFRLRTKTLNEGTVLLWLEGVTA